MKYQDKSLSLLFLGLLIFAGVKISKAQSIPLLPDSADQVFVSSNNSVFATAVPFGISYKFAFGGFIDNDLKDEGQKRLANENKVAVSSFNEVRFLSSNTSLLGESWFWGLGIGFNGESFNQITKDFYNLTFYGNKPYAGQTLSFSNTSLNLLSYSFAQVTVGKTFPMSKGHAFAQVDGGIYVGHSLVQFELNEGSLFTEQNGDYIDVTLKGSIMVSDSNFTTNAGTGFGGNLKFGYKSAKTAVIVQANNIGVMNWKTNLNSSIDTTFRFEGIVVDDIFDFSDSIVNKLSLDTLTKNESAKNSTALPMDISIYASRQFGFLTLDGFIMHRLNANFSPYAKVGAYLNFGPLNVGGGLGYGGYGELHPGLNVGLKMSKFRLLVGTHNFLAALGTSSQSSLNAFVNLNIALD